MSVAAYLPRVVALVTHLHRPAAPSRMAQLIEQVSADYRQQARIEVIETTLADLLPLARRLESRQQADVILCSGAAADYLRQHLCTTVRTLHLGEFDLIRALVQARDRASKVGILSFAQPYPELAAMQALFTLQIREHTYTCLEQASRSSAWSPMGSRSSSARPPCASWPTMPVPRGCWRWMRKACATPSTAW